MIGNFVEGRKNGGIDGSSVVKKGAGNGLDTLGGGFVEKGGGVGVGILDLLAVNRFDPLMRSMLGGFRRDVLKFGEGLGDVGRHRDVDITGTIVPVNSETEIAGAGPILSEVVAIAEGSEKMIGIGFAKIFMPKSSTASVKVVGRSLCFHKSGVKGAGE